MLAGRMTVVKPGVTERIEVNKLLMLAGPDLEQIQWNPVNTPSHTHTEMALSSHVGQLERSTAQGCNTVVAQLCCWSRAPTTEIKEIRKKHRKVRF